jgi:hypothetical protein
MEDAHAELNTLFCLMGKRIFNRHRFKNLLVPYFLPPKGHRQRVDVLSADVYEPEGDPAKQGDWVSRFDTKTTQWNVACSDHRYPRHWLARSCHWPARRRFQLPHLI